MSPAPRPLAERLRAGDALRLLFVKPGAPAEVEAAGYAGFDAVILDAEHGAASGPALEHLLRAADAATTPALVRVPSAQASGILEALDAGATGVVVPHITSAAEAEAVLAAAHYPPRGRRGLALTTRAGRHGTVTVSEHLARAEAETVVVVQIEDAVAVPRAGEILAVDGVDAVLIGATDLSVSLGHPGDTSHQDVQAAIESILAAARAHGVPAANVVSSSDQLQAWYAAGGTVAVFVATQLVRDAFRAAAGSSAGVRAGARADVRAGTVSGEGAEPLVLLPGMLGTAELWDDVAPILANVAALRFGRIDLDDSIEEMAESVLAASPDRFALAGHSLGAIVALAVARRAPDRVTRLALLNASARPASDVQLAAWGSIEERIRAGQFAAYCAEFARQNLPPARQREDGLCARVEAMARAVGPRGLLRQLSAQRTRPDARPELAAVGCPTVVVSGALDEVCPAALQQELALGIPRARLETLEGCGHMSPLEAPERLATLIAGCGS